ncbi:MAG: nitroreductase family protein [Bacteroidales bacterium]|nr:nitroreductase family protein [Bacteroidales bacterium]MBN2819027.1 nitroreductase family protein [Bacteroidales bacterium]
MELFEALFSRRSIRKYLEKEIADSQIEQIIEAGMFAPSAVNKQPWHFIVFRNSETIKSIIEVHPNAGMLVGASAGILICFDKQLEHDHGYGPIDCSAATQNMLLAAHGLGIGSCWVGIYPRENRIEALHKLFNLPEHVIPFAVISLGYSELVKSKPDRFKKDRIHYEKW